MIVDPIYCMSSYLMYRTIVDPRKCFSLKRQPSFFPGIPERKPVYIASDLYRILRNKISQWFVTEKPALMLSGGMDSAILASCMPSGSQTYTLKCLAPGAVDETHAAGSYAKKFSLYNTVIPIKWSDYEKYAVALMKRKGQPIHSIEVQIYKAALQAKKDGFTALIFGETADIIYGGHDKLLARDWTFDEFLERFSFVDPSRVLRYYTIVTEPIIPSLRKDDLVDVYHFLNRFEYPVSLNFYYNACSTAGIKLCVPYAYTYLNQSLDLRRIRNGDSKYIIRELFHILYPDLHIPDKTPLPRAMDVWLKDWRGPEQEYFLPQCINDLSGDQRWYVYALDQFLKMA